MVFTQVGPTTTTLLSTSSGKGCFAYTKFKLHFTVDRSTSLHLLHTSQAHTGEQKANPGQTITAETFCSSLVHSAPVLYFMFATVY